MKASLVQPITSNADRYGRISMAVVASGALGAFLLSIPKVVDAAPESEWVEIWRSGGFLMFTGLFTIVALRPRLSPGLWELAFLHKFALAVIAPFSADPEAGIAGLIDLLLALVIAGSYALTKGWKGWTAVPAVIPRPST